MKNLKTEKNNISTEKIFLPVASGFGQRPGNWIVVNREQNKL